MLKYLKADRIAELEESIELNKEKYIAGEILVKSGDYLESNLPFKEISLLEREKGDLKDFENTKIVYKALKHLTPLEASDPRIWVGLTHTEEGIRYAKQRWQFNENTSKGTYKDRMFSKVMRNSYSRLWWYGYTTYNEELDNPWELTEIITKNQDLAVGIMERAYSNNKDFVQVFLMALSKWEKEGKKIPKAEALRSAYKDIRRMSSITIIDLIEVEEVEAILEKYA